MTDLAPPDHDLVPCPTCGAQNDPRARTCDRCGNELPIGATPADETEEVELEEAWRAAAAGGFDTDLTLDDAGVGCPACGSTFALGDASDVAVRDARDTLAPDRDPRVVTLHCPVCGAAGRLQDDAAIVEPLLDQAGARPDPDARPDEVPFIHDHTPGSTEEHPLGADERFFERAEPGNLKDQGSLLDDEGEDIRQYTGEPVETLDGWVLPQQQNVGPGNEAGGGEWPDPTTPPAQGYEAERR